MITITRGVEEAFTPTTDTLLCANKVGVIQYQTDNTEPEWGILRKGEKLNVPAGVTMYFKAAQDTTLAEIKL